MDSLHLPFIMCQVASCNKRTTCNHPSFSHECHP